MTFRLTWLKDPWAEEYEIKAEPEPDSSSFIPRCFFKIHVHDIVLLLLSLPVGGFA